MGRIRERELFHNAPGKRGRVRPHPAPAHGSEAEDPGVDVASPASEALRSGGLASISHPPSCVLHER
eukprot:4103008-Alexandrium_andersonii.AAC.1